jgi:hypothetical protein
MKNLIIFTLRLILLGDFKSGRMNWGEDIGLVVEKINRYMRKILLGEPQEIRCLGRFKIKKF